MRIKNQGELLGHIAWLASPSLIVRWPVLNARVQVVFQDAFQTLKIPEPEHAGGEYETGNRTERVK